MAQKRPCVMYTRTSSAANVGAEKDFPHVQRNATLETEHKAQCSIVCEVAAALLLAVCSHHAVVLAIALPLLLCAGQPAEAGAEMSCLREARQHDRETDIP